MRLSRWNKTLKMFSLTVAACALLAVGAGSASAAPVAANWSPAGPVKLQGSLTLKLNGGTPVVCPNVSINAPASGSSIWLFNGSPYFACDGGTQLKFGTTAWFGWSEAGSLFVESIVQGGSTPFGALWWEGTSMKLDYTNASGKKPSQISYVDDQIGTLGGGQKVTATGTLAVTTSTGGVVTLK